MLDSKYVRRPWRWALVALAVVSLLVAGPGVADADLELGSLSFGKARVKPLTRVMRAVPTPRFYMRVGGVAFSSVARPDGGLKILSLTHDPRRPDGSRLIASIGNPEGGVQRVVAKIYDWELGPIARFADSEYHACVTLFGETDEELTDDVRHVINYHPGFQDTLMGLRLLQADLLAFVPEATDLFKDDGRYLLGAGESRPSALDVMRNRSRFARVDKWIDAQPKRFRSYVLSDKGRTVTFGVSQGTLTLSGRPIWDCWRYTDAYEKYLEKEGPAMEKLRGEYALARQLLGEEAALKKFNNTYVANRLRIATGMDEPSESERVQVMPGYSKSLTEKIEEASGINPVIYAAVLKTMRYAALFRHFKAKDAVKWQAFLGTVRKLGPRVESPGTMKARALASRR